MTRLYRIGSLAIDTETGVQYGSINITDPGHYMTFENPVGVDYQVPAGKILVITKLLFSLDTAGATIRIGYGDDGVPSQAAPPTNSIIKTQHIKAKTTDELYKLSTFIKIPAQKYPFATILGGKGPAHIWGIEI